MKTQILLYFLVIFSGCQLTLSDGENQYEIGLTDSESEINIDEKSESIKQHMNLELIKLIEFNPESILISEISAFGEIRREVGVFEILENKVLIPKDIELNGFYHFELIFEDHSVEIIAKNIKPMPKNHKKNFNKKGSSHSKLKYILGPKDKRISDETMHLVLERGYLLAPSYDFILKRFLHDTEHHFDYDGQRVFQDDTQPFEDEAPIFEGSINEEFYQDNFNDDFEYKD
jgi:hypothetical protein